MEELVLRQNGFGEKGSVSSKKQVQKNASRTYVLEALAGQGYFN
jgi:hypothetical protein